MRREIALLYAKEFTAAELDHMTQLYKDPVMRKWTDVGPAMAAEMLPLIDAAAESHQAELDERIETTVNDYYAAKKQKPDS